MTKRVGFSERDPLETTYSYNNYNTTEEGDNNDNDNKDDIPTQAFSNLKQESFGSYSEDREFAAADRLSMRLLNVPDDDEEQADRILRESLHFAMASDEEVESIRRKSMRAEQKAGGRFTSMLVLLMVGGVALLAVVTWVGAKVIGPPSQPLGPYQLVERQEGPDFFNFYTFYEGRDSLGSNGYLMYVNQDKATSLGIANVTYEKDILDMYSQRENDKKTLDGGKVPPPPTAGSDGGDSDTKSAAPGSEEGAPNNDESINNKTEPFIYMGSSPTEAGPRDSIRLEGKRRFNRGLFIIDVRHMPAGCGVWPAFWLTDEANWPVNGEIDIVEGVNYQSHAKTALHSTKGCVMDDIPAGTMTGEWDPSVGIPNRKTGIPDMTMRYAQNCFVYDPRQWLNQGCVAVDRQNGTLGMPLNKKGGGVYALEWDPMYRHMRTWVFTPHKKVPTNMRDAIRTANLPPDQRVMPDPDKWPIPYGYFAIGEGTNCPANHFKNMRLVFNLAFCGSVAGNRFQLDCPAHAKQFDTCNEYVASEPKELEEAYWKIRGVFVYERSWERAWMK